MKQLWHIFKKDLRAVGGELAVFLGCLLLGMGGAVVLRVDSDMGEPFVLAVGCYLIARLIHVDVIPGDRQFWLTRPYRWKSLLGAKFLFVMVCIHLPVFIGQAVLLARYGFSIPGNLPGLLWTQVLMFLAFTLPAAALASVTTGLVGFLFSAIGALVLWTLLRLLLLVWFPGPLFRFQEGEFSWRAPLENGLVGWVQSAMLLVLMAIVALPILYLQYRKRETGLSRFVIATALPCVFLLFTFQSLDFRWSIQALASRRTVDPSSIQFSVGKRRLIRGQVPWALAGGPFEFPWAEVPLFLKGIPHDAEVRWAKFDAHLETRDGKPLNASVFVGLNAGLPMEREPASDERLAWLSLELPGGLYQQMRTERMVLKGTVVLVFYEYGKPMDLSAVSVAANLRDSLRCEIQQPKNRTTTNLFCLSAFRRPRFAFAEDVDSSSWPYMASATGQISNHDSFSPFPADLHLNPVLPSTVTAMFKGTPSKVMLREPVSFVRKSFEIPIQLEAQ